MKKAIATKWVKALRSGKYKQISGALHQGKEFCCLGVLCDISGKAKWKITEDCNSYLKNDETLPKKIQTWAGIASEDGTYFGEKGLIYSSLMSANDDGVSFKEIADFIEENYKDL